jgi:uncharacterized protein YecE (DUF72 family)
MEVRVGCCGLAGLSLTKYSELFDAIEINSTFYRLPRINTALRWFETTRGKLAFSMKAFQGITHPITSPTWKRVGSQKPTKNVQNYGRLKPTKENLECWNKTLEICKALHATVCVIQLPPSFTCTDASINDALKFFRMINRHLDIAIEFRHKSWFEKISDTKRLVSKANLIHITDALKEMPVSSGKAYYRLHGPGKQMYKYSYTNEDLRKLREVIHDMRCEVAYVMFNNLSMREDALRFKKIPDE